METFLILSANWNCYVKEHNDSWSFRCLLFSTFRTKTFDKFHRREDAAVACKTPEGEKEFREEIHLYDLI